MNAPDHTSRKQPEIIGTTIDGKFRILNALGEGSFGSVYKAEQIDLSRIVALKLLSRTALADSTARARFEREATLLAAIQHKNIVRVYGYGMADGEHPYLYMEYLQGKTLDTLISRQRPFSWQKTASVGLQICNALSAAHKHGIVHRDLSPRNIIFVNEGGRDLLKLLDFGLSSVLIESGLPLQRITQTGEVVGTVVYMSPEVGRGTRADVRSDIYSLGCILYECITGRPACDGNDVVEIMSKHQLDMPAPILTAANSLDTPKEVELVIFKALQKEPEHRYQSAEEFSAALALLAEGRASEIHLPRVQIGTKQPTRFKPRFLLTLAALFVLVAGLTVAFLSSPSAPEIIAKLEGSYAEPTQPEPDELERIAYLKRAASDSPGRLIDYVWGRINAAEQLLESNRASQAIPILDGLNSELETNFGDVPSLKKVHQMLTVRTKLAKFWLSCRRLPKAERYASKVVAYMDTHDVEKVPALGFPRIDCLYVMANAVEHTGTPAQALSWGQRAWDYIQKAPDEVREERYTAAAGWLGEHYLLVGDHAKAVTFLTKAIDAASVLGADSSDPWYRNRAQIYLADAYLQMSATAATPAKRKEFASMAEKTLKTLVGSAKGFAFRRLSGVEIPLTNDALKLSNILHASGEAADAVELLKSVLQFQQQTNLLANHASLQQALN